MGLGDADKTSSLMSDFLRQSGGVAVIDGGLATELERHGADLNDPLWSAKCLLTSPHLIRSIVLGFATWIFIHAKKMKDHHMPSKAYWVHILLSWFGIIGVLMSFGSNIVQVHLDYLEAGADIIITASYQATIQGFEAKGFSRGESEALLKRSVEVACEARDIYYDRCRESSCDHSSDGRVLKHRPILVAASVGSYGAYLADGSEYSGNYGDAMNLEFLKDFHRRRVQILAESGADLIAFETVPNKLEAQAFAKILEEDDIRIPAWFSFNSKDGVNVVSGDSLLECAGVAESCKKVVAVGINCTPPRYIHALILSIKKVTSKPILIYPNSGESYDPEQKVWVQNTGVSDEDFISYVSKWCEVGASLVGGCCRTTPKTIRAIYRTFANRPAASSLG